VHGLRARSFHYVAKTYEGDELATRVFVIMAIGVGAAITAMLLIGL
jgi:hypothetical protein